MPQEIRLNAFDMNCVGHIQQGLWTHPRDQSGRYTELQYWMDYAKKLETGLFDGLFLADVVGVYDVYGGNADAALRGAVQVPANDPLMIVPAMAAVTKHLGFGVTCNLTYEQPFLFARRMSTLDHLTGGRIGWNIVTGYLDSAARAIGIDHQLAHDDRYDLADEYMSLVYKLWEGSWADDAVLNDREKGVYASPSRVRTIQHTGAQYRVNAMHLCSPSPQRTPVLYQAGSSTRGRQFAATHAECVFVNGQKKEGIKEIVADIRQKAVVQVKGEKIPARNLSTTTQAQNFDAYQGVTLVDRSKESGTSVEANGAGSWIAFEDADLGNRTRTFTASVAKADAGDGTIQIRLDSPTGRLVGTATVASTGDRYTYATVTAALDDGRGPGKGGYGHGSLQGRHDVYLVFDSTVRVGDFSLGS